VEAQNQQLQQQVESLQQRLRCRQVLAEADTRAKKK
jgi:AmiR/NasT family two-component response regulator